MTKLLLGCVVSDKTDKSVIYCVLSDYVLYLKYVNNGKQQAKPVFHKPGRQRLPP